MKNISMELAMIPVYLVITAIAFLMRLFESARRGSAGRRPAGRG